MRLVLLINFDLVVLLLFIQSFRLFKQLLVISLQLLGQQSDLAIFLINSLVERVRQLLHLFVELVLNLLGLFLLEQNLVFVVDLSLSESLVTLITDI